MKEFKNNYTYGDWFIIINEFEDAFEISCKPNKEKFPRVAIGTVIDEEKSVRWNREKVEEYRRSYEEEEKRLRKIKNDRINQIVDVVIELIANELYNIPYFKGMDEDIIRKKAEKIYYKAYDHGHSSGIRDVLTYVEEYVDLITDMIG